MASMSSGATGAAAISKEEEMKRRAMLEEQVQMRLAIDNKALQIVERLLDNPIAEDFLVDCAKFIITQHYRDAVEERSILKQCGYPLCQRSLPNVPKQKYHISRKTNQVYDITDRKNFCRQFCYKASKFYEAQLSDSPLWAREIEGPLTIELLTEDMEADSKVATLIAKDQVLLTDRIKTEDINTSGKSKVDQPLKEEAIGLLADDLSSMTFAGSRRKDRLQELEEISGSHTTSQDKPRTIVNLVEESSKDDGNDSSDIIKGTMKVLVEGSESHTKQIHNPKESMMVDIQSASTSYQTESSLKTTQAESKKKTKKKSKKTHQSKATEISLLDVVGKAVMEWKTLATIDFLHGCEPSARENPERQEVDDAAGGHAPANPDPSCTPPAISDPPCPPVKPLPGMDYLKEETKQYDLKVQEFYYGQTAEVKKDNKKSGTGDIQEKDEVDRKIRLPLIDSKSQMSIRRRIVSDRLKREYCEILGPMRLSLRDISSDLQALLCTFHLSSHNITHKPASWTLLAILLLTILAQHNKSIRDSLSNDANRGFIEILLAKMDTSMEKLREVINFIEASNL